MDDITNLIRTETAKSDVCGKNGSNDLFSYISYLFNEVKFKQLKEDITGNLKVELKELVEQNCKKLKSDLSSYLGHRQGEVILVLLDKISDLQKEVNDKNILILTLLKKCQCSEFFWSVLSRIRSKYGEILCISPYSVRLR